MSWSERYREEAEKWRREAHAWARHGKEIQATNCREIADLYEDLANREDERIRSIER